MSACRPRDVNGNLVDRVMPCNVTMMEKKRDLSKTSVLRVANSCQLSPSALRSETCCSRTYILFPHAFHEEHGTHQAGYLEHTIYVQAFTQSALLRVTQDPIWNILLAPLFLFENSSASL